MLKDEETYEKQLIDSVFQNTIDVIEMKQLSKFAVSFKDLMEYSKNLEISCTEKVFAHACITTIENVTKKKYSMSGSLVNTGI